MTAGSPAFGHDDPGTAESSWLGHPSWETAPCLEVAALVRDRPRVVVLSAHPDDETLGVGGLLCALAREGAEVVVEPCEVSVARSVTVAGSKLARMSLTPHTLRLALLGKVFTVGDEAYPLTRVLATIDLPVVIIADDDEVVIDLRDDPSQPMPGDGGDVVIDLRDDPTRPMPEPGTDPRPDRLS